MQNFGEQTYAVEGWLQAKLSGKNRAASWVALLAIAGMLTERMSILIGTQDQFSQP